MIPGLKLENILFLDIETVPDTREFDEQSEKKQMLWDKKTSYQRKEDEEPGDLWERAGLYAEFGRVVCISAGIFPGLSSPMRFRIKSFFGPDELNILDEFSGLLNRFRKGNDLRLCAHNGKEFDFPFLARRMMICGLALPDVLNVAGRKPWELNFIDTLELWKFGEYRHFTSLALLTEVLGISNPKDDIDGSEVARVYYEDKDYDRIARYCEKDVLAGAQVLLRLMGMELIPEENVEITGNTSGS
jgi:DNA polymerase elongation subunit (family B)